MDIHKPKPWHGWREFLKEYVIIVVGVLTALAAEQGVEWLHWRHLAGHHEEDLRSGTTAIALTAELRMAIDPCVTSELRRVAETLRQPGPQWKGINPSANGAIIGYLPPPLIVPTRVWPHVQWESALADGSLTHMPAARLRAYSIAYRSSQAANDQQEKVFELMPELTPLAFDQALTPQDKARYLALVSRVDQADHLLVAIARTALTVAANEDLWPSKPETKQLMDTLHARLGDCVREPSRADYLRGGALAQSGALPTR